MDSAKIAVELESRHPTPSLRLNPELEEEVADVTMKVFVALAPYFFYCTPNYIAPADVEWIKEDRAKRFNTTVEELFEKKRDPAPFFEAAKPKFEELREVLTKHKIDEGPFILGSKPCYADFIPVGQVQMFTRIGDEGYASYRDAAPRELLELYEACRKWTERQD